MRTIVVIGLIGGLLAGCSSDWTPGTARLDVQRGHATQAPSAHVPFLAPTRSRIAGLADRGSLIAYGREQSIRRGAYTWHPVELSEAYARHAIAQGGMVVSTPGGQAVRLQYGHSVEHPDGNWTWVGQPTGSSGGSEAMVTFGDKAVFGTIPNGSGAPLQLTTVGGRVWLVETDKQMLRDSGGAKLSDAGDFLTAPMTAAGTALAARAKLASAPAASAMRAQAAPVAAAAGTTSAPTVDLVVGYTAAFATRLGGQSQALTRLNFMVDIANQAYENSQVTGRLRLVHALQVNYPDATSNRSALLELTGVNCTTVPSGQLHLPDRDVNCTATGAPAALQPLLQAREQYRADLVSLVRILQVPENESCGVAWLLGGGQHAIDANSAQYGMSVISDTSGSVFNDDGNTCRDETLAHELGHNMGLAHDRVTAAGTDDTNSDGNPLDPQEFGRYPYAFGYGTAADAGNFYTVMSIRQGTQTGIRVFSNPRVSICAGLPCGVANEEDNARALEQTMPVIASFRTPVGGAAWLRGDFDGDGKSDILWRNTSNGVNSIWKAANPATSQAVSTVGQPWVALGAADFDGDHKSDILWRNFSTGANAIWKSGNSATSQAVATVTGQAWTIVGAGDFNGDGKADLLWRNVVSGSNAIWLSGNAATQQPITAVTVQAWTIVGVGDFNADGRSDILWRNTSSGANAIWLSGNAATQQRIDAVPVQAWTVAGVADFDGDGKADVLWRHLLTGSNAIWKSGNSATSQAVTAVASQAWVVVGVGDFDGDHKADILWRNVLSGANTIWKSANSATPQTVSTLSNLTWTVAG